MLLRTSDVARVAPQDVSKDAVGALLGRVGRLPEAVDGVDLVQLDVIVGEETAVEDDEALAQDWRETLSSVVGAVWSLCSVSCVLMCKCVCTQSKKRTGAER